METSIMKYKYEFLQIILVKSTNTYTNEDIPKKD